MNIIVIGSSSEFKVVKGKLGQMHTYTCVEDASLALNEFEDQDLVIDFVIADDPESIDGYGEIEGLSVLLNIPKISLSEIHFYKPEVKCRLFGFNGLRGFFENEQWEVSILFEKDRRFLKSLFESLDVPYNLVQDRVGMIAPRVVCMIINEALHTVMEGTATPEDIDNGMKLGTSYPYGPYEWLKRIGIRNVYEILEALYEDTKDERYKIAPMLKRKYMMGEQ